MKEVCIMIFALILMANCSVSEKMKRYNSFKSEINEDLIQKFEKYLPLAYDQSFMAKIRYAPNYTAFGLSGIDVLYKLDESAFKINRELILSSSIIPFYTSADSINIEDSSAEYSTIEYDSRLIAVPNVDIDFCHYGDTCLTWKDLEIVLLDYGETEAFSETINNNPELIGRICNYSIGAFYSQDKKEIIYWCFIYPALKQ